MTLVRVAKEEKAIGVSAGADRHSYGEVLDEAPEPAVFDRHNSLPLSLTVSIALYRYPECIPNAPLRVR